METGEVRKAVLAAIGAIAPEADLRAIRPDRPLREQVELDSMDWLNVVAGLRDRLSIEIPDSDLERLATLDSIVALVESRQAEPPGAHVAASAAACAELPRTHHVVGGAAVTVRPICPDDLSLEADFVRRLSADARYQRFMVTLSELSQAKLHYFTEVDQKRHVALVAVVHRGGAPAIIGAARYIVDDAGTGCEFAIAVDDAWQGSGLAGILMHALIDVARARGLATMEGTVLTTNTRMLKFTRQLGFTEQHDRDDRDSIRVARPL